MLPGYTCIFSPAAAAILESEEILGTEVGCGFLEIFLPIHTLKMLLKGKTCQYDALQQW